MNTNTTNTAKVAKKVKQPKGIIAPEGRHYFLSSAIVWVTGTNLTEQVKRMKSESSGYCTMADVYLVHLPEDAKYDIAFYAPVLPREQCTYIGRVHF